MLRRIITLPQALFLLTVGLVFVPGELPLSPADEKGVLAVLLLAELVYLHAWWRKSRNRVQVGDVTAVFFLVIFIWELLTAKLNVIDAFLFPYPQQVVELFFKDLPIILTGLGSSLFLLVSAYALALLLAIPAGLLIGWKKRLFELVQPLTKLMSAIPPIVYIPYAIAMLPNFKMASILVIFIGAFWPIFVSTINATVQIDKKIIDSARMLRVSEGRMLYQIILPAIMPQVLTGCSVGLIFAFILLTSAEIIGATSGIGWYVKYYADFGDYAKVIVGIIFIGMVVTAVMYVFERIQHHLLRWQETYTG